MSSTARKAQSLLKKINDEGLTPELANAVKDFLLELDVIIAEGSKEYGKSTVSTPESRYYENAEIAKIDITKILHTITTGIQNLDDSLKDNVSWT